VNSVGHDYYLRHVSSLGDVGRELLQGKRKGGFLSLEQKLEKFPEILREDNRRVIITTDPNQTKDPFKSFLSNIKEVRDSSMHFTPIKEAIWRKPDEWIELATSTSRMSMEVASAFWTACHPGTDPPDYIAGLDYSVHLKTAIKRFTRRYDEKLDLSEEDVGISS